MSNKVNKDLGDFGLATTWRKEVDALSRAHARLQATNKILQDELTSLRATASIIEHIDQVVTVPPAWTLKPRGKGKLHHGMPTLLLSDCHFDEVIRPEEVEGMNACNRQIAVQRLERTLDRAICLTHEYFHGLTYDGFVVMLGGDILSGNIHEELIESNEDTVYSSLDFWSGQIAGFLNGLQKEFGSVHCVGVVGNHGRRTRKPVAKRRVRDNLDWLLYRMASRSTPNVTWVIPDSADVEIPIYNSRFRLTHGDQFKGGSGISGMLGPILLGQHRKAQQQMALGKPPFDWLVMGHFHQYLHGRGIIVNGSLKGFDEYAYVNNFRYEPPQQAFFLTTPETGCAFAAPIFCSDRKAEKW